MTGESPDEGPVAATPPTSAPEGKRYQDGIAVELACLRTLIVSVLGVVASDANDVDGANGIVRRVGVAAQDAVRTYPVDNDVYEEEEFRRLVSARVVELLGTLSFSKP